MNMFEPPEKPKQASKWTQGLKIKHIRKIMFAGALSMLVGFFTPWKMVFWIGLMIVLMSYQMAVEKWMRLCEVMEKKIEDELKDEPEEDPS